MHYNYSVITTIFSYNIQGALVKFLYKNVIVKLDIAICLNFHSEVGALDFIVNRLDYALHIIVHSRGAEPIARKPHVTHTTF